MRNSDLIESVAGIYAWIDSHQALQWPDEQACRACGKCCDFEAFDHSLFVTTPELLYFAEKMAPEAVKSSPPGLCPYHIAGKCTVYEHRFAGCRIFNCRADADAQSAVSEQAIARFKAICGQLGIDYRYVELSRGLSELAGLSGRSAEESCPGDR